MTFDFYVDGVDVLARTFLSAADAQAWSANQAVDLGSLAADPRLDAEPLETRREPLFEARRLHMPQRRGTGRTRPACNSRRHR